MKLSYSQVIPTYFPHLSTLYALLGEREEYQNISHQRMPTFAEHCKFVQSIPYRDWQLIFNEVTIDQYGSCVGAMYLTGRNEIGIFLFKQFQGKGYAKEALEHLMSVWPGPFLANINPENQASIKFFMKLGFELKQVTYAWEKQTSHRGGDQRQSQTELQAGDSANQCCKTGRGGCG